MRLLLFLRSLGSAIFRRSRVENDMEEELCSHLRHRADGLERSGLARSEAERQARIEFGGLEHYKEDCRESLGFLVVEPMCVKAPTQSDTISEGICNNFRQKLYTALMHGQHVAVTGSYFQDMEHGWREIHPVTTLVVAQ